MSSRLLAARWIGQRVLAPRLAGAGGLLNLVPELVESPTRLNKMRRTATAGDTLLIDETLKGTDGAPQDLTGASVTFTLVAPDGATKPIDKAGCTVRSASTGKVRFRGVVPDVPGVYTFEFEATWDDGDPATDRTFPDDSKGQLTVIAQLA